LLIPLPQQTFFARQGKRSGQMPQLGCPNPYFAWGSKKDYVSRRLRVRKTPISKNDAQDRERKRSPQITQITQMPRIRPTAGMPSGYAKILDHGRTRIAAMRRHGNFEPLARTQCLLEYPCARSASVSIRGLKSYLALEMRCARSRLNGPSVPSVEAR
jgi:hypothetical protein